MNNNENNKDIKSTVSVSEAREIVTEALEGARSKFEKIGLQAGYEVKDYFGDDEKKEGDLVALFGLMTLRQGEEEMFLPLDVYLCDEDKIALDEIEGTVKKFEAFTAGLAEKLDGAEDRAAEMKKINDELEAEIAGEMQRVNKSVKNTVMTAVIAAAVMLVLAGICILVSTLF